MELKEGTTISNKVVESFRILLVDDRPENLLTLENIIEQQSRIIRKAASGNEALKIAISEKIDLILLDVQMPEMDGYEVAALLRLNAKTKHIPVIFVSAISRNEKGPINNFEEGTIDFLFKPLDISETKTKVALFEKIYFAETEKTLLSTRLGQLSKEMEHFVYVVSHDVKAPLRAIDNLATWIEDDLEGTTNQNLIENILLMKNRVARMQNLMEGITEYSRVGRINESKEQVEVAQLIQYIIDTLNPQQSFKIEIQKELPALFTEKTKLLKVFTHLINNSIVHHHQKEGNIKISCSAQQNTYQFTISDDGPGIKLPYQEKVFDMFHTLQARDKHETAGVGLSIVKKIVESVGHKVWIDQTVTTGTTIHFTWS